MKNEEGDTPLHLALIKKYEEEDSNLKTNYHEVAKFLIEKDPDACTDLNEANKDPLDLAIKAQDKELQQPMSSKSPTRYAGHATIFVLTCKIDIVSYLTVSYTVKLDD